MWGSHSAYQSPVKEMRALKIDPHSFRGDWNYVVIPRTQEH